MKKIITVLLSLCLFCGLLGNTLVAFADVGGYGITITKYKLTKEEVASLLPTDGSKADLTGKALEPLAGIEYQVVRVTPENGKFVPVQGESAFTATITTNADGVASLTGLPQGTYQVTELKNPQVTKVMEPVVLELPLPRANGESLNHVYLYPKSGVTNGGSLPSTGGTSGGGATGGTSGTPNKLPQTSGNMGSYYALISIFSMVLILGIFGMISIHKKQRTL